MKIKYSVLAAGIVLGLSGHAHGQSLAKKGPPGHAGPGDSIGGPGRGNGPPPDAGPPEWARGPGGNPGGGPPDWVSGPGGNPGSGPGNGSDDDDGDDDELDSDGDGDSLLPPPGQCGLEPVDDIPGPAGQSGRSHTAHVNFISLDEFGEVADSEDAPWGRMTYFWKGPRFDFVFNGKRLPTGDEAGVGFDGNQVYVLAAELGDLESGFSLLCLGSAAVNNGGNVHILESVELDDHLPPGLDPYAEVEEGEPAPGVGLLLLPAEAADCETGDILGDAVLYTAEDILYVDTDLLEENGG